MIKPITDIIIYAPTLSIRGKKQVYQGELVALIDENGDPVTDEHGVQLTEWMFPVTDSCERSATVMGEDYVRLQFNLNKRIQFEAFSFIEYDGQTFFLKETYRPKNNGTWRENGHVVAAHYTYDMKFVSLANMLDKHTCLRNVQVVNETWNEPEININGTLDTLYTMIIGSIGQAANRIRTTRLYYKQCLQSLVANAENGKKTANTDLVTFSFSGTSIVDALNTIANGYKETEWYITEDNGSFTLNICKHENTDAAIIRLSDEEFANTGADKDMHPTITGGLKSCEYAQEWNGIVERIMPFGSDRNMIKQMATDGNTNMLVSYGKRLRLDPTHKVYFQDGLTYDEYIQRASSGTAFGTQYPTASMRRKGITGCYVVKDKEGNAVLLGVDADGAVSNPDENIDTGIERVLFYDDVYPQCHFKITKVEEQTKRIDGQLQPRFTIEGVAVDENKYPKSVLANMGMFPIKIIEAETLSVVFESGLLNGREFEITNKTTKDAGVTEYSLRFSIVADGDITEGTLIPSGNFVPKVGDEFALFNMKMPQEFVDMARDELAQKTYDDLVELANTRPEVKCVADEAIFDQYDMYLGKRMEITSEIFASDAKFISRVVSYNFKMSSPSAVSFSLASAIMEGTISSIENAIGEQTGQIGGLDQRTVNLSRRGWHDASEMAEMLDSLTTEMMLVGVEKNQFAFTSAIRCINGRNSGGIDHFDHLQIGNGVLQHTQKDWIDHHEGRWYIEPVDNLHTCNNSDESINTNTNKDKPYYLYAFVDMSENGDEYARMKLFDMDYCSANSIESDEQYLLLGILSSEFEDNGTSYRVFNRSNGYTQIAGGTITTEVIQDPTRSLIIDFASDPPRIIARNKAQIVGNIEFKLEEDEHFQSALDRILGVENFAKDFEVGGRNYVLRSDTEISTSGAKATEAKSFEYSFDTAVLLQKIRGKKVTLSVQVEMTNAVAATSGTYHRAGFEPSIVYKDGSVQYLNLWEMLTDEPKTMNKRISKTFDIADKEIDRLSQKGMYIQNVASGTIKVSRPKWEFGTIVTDWTPAPEDIDADIATAEAKAAAAQEVLSNMAADNKLTPQEKLDLEREWVEIQSEYTKNKAQAVTYGVSTTAYEQAFNALKVYLVGAGTSVAGLIGIGGAVNSAQMQTTSDIVSATFKAKFKDYYDANIDLLNAISDAINAKAGESGQNLIGEKNPYRIETEGTNNYNWWSLVGKFGTYTRGAAVNQTWLENGKEYTFCVDKVQNFGFSANKFSAGLYNGSSTRLQTFDIKEGRQTYKFTVPSDGTNWGFIIYPAEAGSTAGKGAIFTNLALYEGSHSPDFYKEYIKHLTDALHGTTEVSGGMVMTNVIMLKGTDGNTRAGMSGLEDDNVMIWADADATKGSYANALAQSKKSVENIDDSDITTLIKKDGTSKIGIFRIGTDKVVVKVPGQGSVLIDVTNGISIRNTSDVEKVLVTPKSISNYKPGAAEIDKYVSYSSKQLSESTYYDYNVLFQFTLTEESTVSFRGLTARSSNVSGTIRGMSVASMSGNLQFVLKSGNTTWWSSGKKTINTYNGSGSFSISENEFTVGTRLPAGTYKMYILLSNVVGTCSGYYGNTGSMSASDVSGYVYRTVKPYVEQKTVVGIDGLLTIKDALQYFMVDNTGSKQKIHTKGLTSDKGSNGELYISSGFINAFKSAMNGIKTALLIARYEGSNAEKQAAAATAIENAVSQIDLNSLIAAS